jgi:hypothetical protein
MFATFAAVLVWGDLQTRPKQLAQQADAMSRPFWCEASPRCRVPPAGLSTLPWKILYAVTPIADAAIYVLSDCGGFTPAVVSADQRRWLRDLATAEAISVYLHVPYCRELCFYCGCNTKQALRDAVITSSFNVGCLARRQQQQIAGSARWDLSAGVVRVRLRRKRLSRFGELRFGSAWQFAGPNWGKQAMSL